MYRIWYSKAHSTPSPTTASSGDRTSVTLHHSVPESFWVLDWAFCVFYSIARDLGLNRQAFHRKLRQLQSSKQNQSAELPPWLMSFGGLMCHSSVSKPSRDGMTHLVMQIVSLPFTNEKRQRNRSFMATAVTRLLVISGCSAVGWGGGGCCPGAGRSCLFHCD